MIYSIPPMAIEPADLARRSGMQRRRSKDTIPPVIRPTLLTGQLNAYNLGVCCAECQTGLGLGFTPITGPLEVPSEGDPEAISVLNTVAMGATFIPGIGSIAGPVIQQLGQFVDQFETWFGIGAGRREADLIVPAQNNMMIHLGQITDSFRVTTSPPPDLTKLMSLYRETWMVAVGFFEFVLLKTFVDRRASGQALNTVMPYIDGTCGYAVPAGVTDMPTQMNCLQWGGGQLGGDGTNGMLGALGRAIAAAGGTVQALPSVESAANQGYKPIQTPPPPGTTSISLMTIGLIGAAALLLLPRLSK